MKSKKEIENIKIINNNVKKFIQFLQRPNDEVMKALYDEKQDLELLYDLLIKITTHERTNFIKNAILRYEEVLRAYEEMLFWLEKNRNKWDNK